jgi:excisionase family DNA binding protein
MPVSDSVAHVERLAYSPAEAAAAIGCSRQHIYNLITRGDLRRFKVGGATRIPVADVANLVGGGSNVPT